MLRRSLGMNCCRLAQCDKGTARGLKSALFLRFDVGEALVHGQALWHSTAVES